MKLGLRVVGSVLLLLLLGVVGLVYLSLPVGAGYMAKMLCSETWVAGRDPAQVADQVRGENPLLMLMRHRIDDSAQVVQAGAFGTVREAAYRPGLGCSLVAGEQGLVELPTQAPSPQPTSEQNLLFAAERYPVETLLAIRARVANEFESNAESGRNTRAIMVLHQGRVLAEQYGAGYNQNTPLLSWSITKSLLATLIGLKLEGDRSALANPLGLPAWQGDAHQTISLGHMLQMNSGVEWDERYYWPLSAVNRMLFTAPSAAGVALQTPASRSPGEHFQYSSGTSNILAFWLRQQFDTHHAYLNFPRRALFEPLGMTSAIMETDASGHFIGSSFSYATLRDWGRFGLFMAQKGRWGDQQLLPADWVDYMAAPSNAHPGYGAHWWLNYDADGNKRWPSLPQDTFAASGHNGQRIVVIPSLDLVVLRFGLTRTRGAFDMERLVADVLLQLTHVLND